MLYICLAFLRGLDMKLNFEKFFMALAMVGAMALAACSDGGSSSDTKTVNGNLSTTISASNLAAIASAKSFASALAGYTILVPNDALSFEGKTIPGGSTLTFTSTAPASSTDTKFISGFEVKTPAGGVFTGDMDAGSCKMKIRELNPVLVALGVYAVGDVFTYEPCEMILDTSGVVVGLNQAVTLTRTMTIILGHLANGQLNTLTFPVTVRISSSGTVEVQDVTGVFKTVGSVQFLTGGTGTTGTQG
jgi:hypothetical protein